MPEEKPRRAARRAAVVSLLAALLGGLAAFGVLPVELVRPLADVGAAAANAL